MIIMTEHDVFEIKVIDPDRYEVTDIGEQSVNVCSIKGCDCDRFHDDDITDEQLDELYEQLNEEVGGPAQ